MFQAIPIVFQASQANRWSELIKLRIPTEVIRHADTPLISEKL